MSETAAKRKPDSEIRIFRIGERDSRALEDSLAVRAGYSERTAMVQASRLLKNVKVAAAVKQARRGRMERTEIDQDWVIKGLVENYNPMEAVPVLDAKGEPTGQYTYNGAVANRALELAGRHLGMFIDRSEVDVTHHKADPLDDATFDELQLMLADLRQ